MTRFRKKIAAFKQAQANARQRGMEILPSVDGPYVVHGERIIGRAGSPEYAAATADLPPMQIQKIRR